MTHFTVMKKVGVLVALSVTADPLIFITVMKKVGVSCCIVLPKKTVASRESVTQRV